MVSSSHSADSLISLCTPCCCLQDSAAPGNEQGINLFLSIIKKTILKVVWWNRNLMPINLQDAIKINLAERKWPF